MNIDDTVNELDMRYSEVSPPLTVLTKDARLGHVAWLHQITHGRGKLISITTSMSR
jgi:hypothetical protein